MANRVFVSPGVYTSETDLTFVTRNIGVTTLGAAGETTKGPAFQPVFIRNYREFQSIFGGLNPELILDNNAPKYELPYIAKSYLSESNQLFVTRVLGFSGYDAGEAWGITIDAALDPSTLDTTISATTFNPLINYTVTTGGTLTNVVISDPVVQQLYDDSLLNLNFLITGSAGDSVSIPTTTYKVNENNTLFSGASFDTEIVQTGLDLSGNTTGFTSGVTVNYSGSSYEDVENQIIAILRSRGSYDGNEVLNFETTSISFDSSVNTALTDPLANFSITGTSTIQGNFNYILSMDRTKKSFITRVLGSKSFNKKTAVFVEELYDKMFERLLDENKVRGINLQLVDYGTEYEDYLTEYRPAVTPYVVSEVRGNKILKLFRFWTISDGNSANEEVKISITNVRLDDREFDVVVRNFYDTDANPVILERFARCNMDPSSNNFIGRRIGDINGFYEARSRFIQVELDEDADSSDAFPAGFLGVPRRDYTENSNPNVNAPVINYKSTYGVFENKRKFYLGLSDTVGYDQNLFNFKGLPSDTSINAYSAMTDGFHMDVDATGVTIDNNQVIINPTGGTYTPPINFITGCCEFKTENGVLNTSYEKLNSRKFTFAPYGGYDGWDIYRTRRTNTDTYRINGSRGQLGLTTGVFSNRALSNEETGINSDYYAYFEAIRTFANPEATNINVFVTPGLDTFDNTNLVEDTIEMVTEDRSDSIYIVTTPDTDSSNEVYTVDDVVSRLDGEFDSNYTATYWPWIQINDAENNVLIYVPPTRDVVRNVALTDNIAFPWFAVAGLERGDVDARQVRKRVTLAERDVLYSNRINPLTYFNTEGIKIWGNKNLQIKETALNRLNVRRLLLQARKLISAASLQLVFDQNDDIVREQFLGLVNPILDSIRSERGVSDFRVEVSDDLEDIDRNELNATIFIKPTPALEYVNIEFIVTPTGASFDDI